MYLWNNMYKLDKRNALDSSVSMASEQKPLWIQSIPISIKNSLESKLVYCHWLKWEIKLNPQLLLFKPLFLLSCLPAWVFFVIYECT